MNKIFLKKMKNSLILQKKEILDKSMECVDIDSDGDETDEIQANMIFNLMNSIKIRNKNKLIDINNALSKIDKNIYGICEDCEDEIPEKRLLNNPHFLICISCAEARELEEKQRKRN